MLKAARFSAFGIRFSSHAPFDLEGPPPEPPRTLPRFVHGFPGGWRIVPADDLERGRKAWRAYLPPNCFHGGHAVRYRGHREGDCQNDPNRTSAKMSTELSAWLHAAEAAGGTVPPPQSQWSVGVAGRRASQNVIKLVLVSVPFAKWMPYLLLFTHTTQANK